MRISDWSSDVCSSDLLKGVFLCGQAAARQMVKQGARPDGSAGAIVNLSSINAVVAIPSITPYCVAKGGVNQLTKIMALALDDEGIRVNAIGAGSINNEMVCVVNDDPVAWNRLMRSEETTSEVQSLLHNTKAV